MSLKKSLLSVVAGLAFATSAHAQVNTVPVTGLNLGNLRQQTFSAVSIGLVPAASATDIWCIAASSAKTVSISQITVSGVATTAVTTPVVILRRNTAVDSGGTAATGIALPVAAANQLGQTSSAVLSAYTANPTINDASPSYLRAGVIGIPTSAAAIAQVLTYSFGTGVEEYDQQAVLVKGSTQQLCVNLNAVSITAGSLAISAEWVEY